MIVTVYSKPGCQPCRQTKQALTRGGVPFVERDVTTDQDALDTVLALGYQSVPVTTVEMEDGVDHWGGFEPVNLKAVVVIAGADQ